MTSAKQRAHDKKRAHAEQMIDEKIRQVKRAMTSLTLWQRRARYHAIEAQVTDEDRAARQEARRKNARAKHKTRAIRLEE